MPGPSERFDILIAGGGFAGLALALAVSKLSAGELVVGVADPGALDPAVPLPVDARASALSAGTQRLLAALGVWPTLAPVVETVTRIDVTDSRLADGVRPVLLSYAPATADGGSGMAIAENAHTVAALLAAAGVAPGVRLMPATRITGHDTTGHGPARATLSDGRTVSAALLVAADGKHSRLRDAAGIRTVAWDYGQHGIVTTVQLEVPHGGVAVQHFLPGGPFALLPLPGDRACVTWSETADEAERLMASDDAAFLAALTERAGGKPGRLTRVGPRMSWPLGLQMARALVAPRVALVGDAVRTVHPIAGQGLNLGLRDVAALAEVVVDAAAAGQDIGSRACLERYERWRRSDGALSATAFDGLNRLFSNDSQLLRTLRDAGLGVVDRLPAVKAWLVGEAAGVTGEVPRLMR